MILNIWLGPQVNLSPGDSNKSIIFTCGLGLLSLVLRWCVCVSCLLGGILDTLFFPFDFMNSPMKEVTAWYPSYRWGSLKPRKAVVWWESHQLVAGLEVLGPQCDAPGFLPWPWQEPCAHTLCLTVSPRLSSLLQVRWVWTLTRSGSPPPLFCRVGKRRWQRRNPDPLSAGRGHQPASCCGLVERGVLHSGCRIQASPGFRIAAGWRGRGLSPKWEPLWSGDDTAALSSWGSAGWDNYRWYWHLLPLWHHRRLNVSPVAGNELANLASIGLPPVCCRAVAPSTQEASFIPLFRTVCLGGNQCQVSTPNSEEAVALPPCVNPREQFPDSLLKQPKFLRLSMTKGLLLPSFCAPQRS